MIAGDDNGEWLSVTAAARKLGLSRQAIQNRIKRNSIAHRRDNMGNPIVRVAATSPQPVSGAIAVHVAATPVAPPEAPKADGTDLVAELRLMLEKQESARERNRREQVAVLEAAEGRRLADLADRDRLHRATVSLLIERVDAAECRAERVEERLDQILDQLLEQRRPWWRRVIGK